VRLLSRRPNPGHRRVRWAIRERVKRTIECGREACISPDTLSPWAMAAMLGPAEGCSAERSLAAGGWRVRRIAGRIAFVAHLLRDVGSYRRRRNPRQVCAAKQTSLGMERNQSPRRRRSGKQIGSQSRLELSPLHLEVSRDHRSNSQGTNPSMAISESEEIFGPILTLVGSDGCRQWLQQPEPPNPRVPCTGFLYASRIPRRPI